MNINRHKFTDIKVKHTLFWKRLRNYRDSTLEKTYKVRAWNYKFILIEYKLIKYVNVYAIKYQ